MNKLQKIATGSLLSLCVATVGSVAMADQRDGTIERFTCLDVNVPDGHLQSTYVKLNANEQGQKLGFGGGDMALKLSNDGVNGGTLYTGVGCAATFVLQKKESEFKIYFKPVKVNPDNCRVYICAKLANGTNGYLIGTLGGFNRTAIGNGWITVSDDLDAFGNGFRGAIIERISIVLNARGDDGHILIGNTQVFSHKDLLDPSTLIMDEVPCTPSLTCGAFNQ